MPEAPGTPALDPNDPGASVAQVLADGGDPFTQLGTIPAPEEPAAPEAGAPAEPVAEEPAAPAAEDDGGFTFDGRTYATLGAAEAASRETKRQWTQFRERAQTAEQKATEYEQILQRLMPELQAKGIVPRDPAQPAPNGQPVAAGGEIDPEVEKLVGPLIEQRVAAARAEIEQGLRNNLAMEATASQTRASQMAAVSEFRTAHPEIAANTPEEQTLANLMQDLKLPLDGDSLERVFTISNEPALEGVVRAMPTLALSDQGIAIARTLAGLPAEQAQAVAGASAASAASAEAARRAAFVETGASGAPIPQAPGTKPLKEQMAELFGEQHSGILGSLGVKP